MNRADDLFDKVFEAIKQEYDEKERRVGQEELNKQKSVPPQSTTLVVSTTQSSSGATMRLPAVRPAADTRIARKLAEQEQIRQWEIGQATTRTGLAVESTAVVIVHGYRVFDRAQNAITDEFYGVKRHEAMNEVMGKFAGKCLSCADSGIMAILESHPKRIAEHL